ncbi:MAG: hypothetical protein A2821_01150 [Candidatus Magasanikbacteria bacterium RIFCSPHIGHO2_01_FULL_41_23]|uniref:Glycerophosphoryl diester phosphodiesterase membrane domain-containing protein n=1 Tax=Candidatus Magasanikbacteria bacterium RIFCSPLOWO2_01_FULL_40_15 TaxID=1798686 RepID=A0A1F6N589_9BACT|nr:MAG: hypothetical protein A2821_01150 [Candidatus Magasanikbacteria bacterium RIFCSPHIGHO2_01_FULL_41_23]OGH66734.1 MAG: hypothetical protein A3C66_01455 [Candidatus Magasanikbacteria bacterium RIFCSPHIGHO2_02_FULL_41_35]OGH74534.1 MAG: hypothetical protein A3F22_02860 [Candidatus Magasanikbacteria bacterium RIFCSPHIGHO2_12_FULL_41_16]OGH78823.1 MAG: hypothetical protein A2983_00610 [Candidatus Magasanikbacteria bacterium RIFCSPLOWO2_01_FULL_40_15]
MLITVSEIIRQTLQTYRDNFREIAKYIALSMAGWILLALNAVLSIPFFQNILSGVFAIIAIAATQLALIGLFVVVSITMTRVLRKLYRHETPDTVPNEFKAAIKVFIPFLIASFLLTLIVLGGSLLLLIPGIIFAIWFYFAPLAVIIDNQKPLAALKASRNLVVGRFGSVLWNLIAPSVVYIVIFSVCSWIILTPGRYFLLDSGMISGYWMSLGLMFLFYFLFLPIMTLTPIIVYENLKDTKIKMEPRQVGINS